MYNGLKHILCRFDVNSGDAARGWQADRPGDQGDLCTGFAGRTCNRKAHLSARKVGDAAHRINRLISRSGGDQYPLTCQHFRRKKSNDVFQQLRRLQHAAIAGFAASLETTANTQHRRTVGLKLCKISLRGRVSIHFPVHGWRYQQGNFVEGPGQAHQTEQIVGPAMQQFGHEVGAHRRNQDRIGLTRQIDMGHVVVQRPDRAAVPLTAVYRPAAQSLQRHRRDELLGGLGHHNLHAGAGLDQRPAQFGGLVAGDTARQAQHNMPARELGHVFRPRANSCQIFLNRHVPQCISKTSPDAFHSVTGAAHRCGRIIERNPAEIARHFSAWPERANVTLYNHPFPPLRAYSSYLT